MPEGFIKASFFDSLRFNLVHAVPVFLQGIFTRSRFWVAFWTRFHPDPSAVKFVNHLRKKYEKECLFIRVLANETLLVIGKGAIKEVLSRSPNIYAEPKLKRNGMSHFQPNAVTISRGDEWRNRRRFNDSVVGAGKQDDLYRDYHLKVIRKETTRLLVKGEGNLTWKEFEELFDKITLQIIFGQRAREDAALTKKLKKMMRESNRVFALGKSRHFDDFYAAIRDYLDSPEDLSLVSLCRQIESGEVTKVENQIPHWMFAMNETLSINTARALALIVSHPNAEKRVRDEMGGRDLLTARGVDGLKYLEACVQEAMRLWPTTPWLIRETVCEDTLDGLRLAPKTQVLILNSFNHRDEQSHPFADRFTPDLWANHDSNFCFNHLSNGPQVCAGKGLALFIAKAVIGSLLGQRRYELLRPRLSPERPLPHMYNNYKLVLHRM
jgi:cytochrome P450